MLLRDSVAKTSKRLQREPVIKFQQKNIFRIDTEQAVQVAPEIKIAIVK